MTTKQLLLSAAAFALMTGVAAAQTGPMSSPAGNSTLGTGVDNRGSSSPVGTQSQTSSGASVGAGANQSADAPMSSGGASGVPNDGTPGTPAGNSTSNNLNMNSPNATTPGAAPNSAPAQH
jgi:hypothetical protein